MGRYVLFSPIGMTDPTRGNYDGAFLHIMRHYRPEKAYLYMTKEVCRFDDKDNRYEIMAKKLQQFLGFSCEIIKIKDYQVDNPQDFEMFYKPFEKIINNIISDTSSKIIVNLSSGTPQIKNACHTICAVSKRDMLTIQVLSPQGKANTEDTVKKDYDLNDEWENLFDNHSELDPPNRCIEVAVRNYRAILSRETILKHLEAYDYNAALRVAEDNSFFLDKRVIHLIKAGAFRLALDFANALEESEKGGYDGLFPVKSGDAAQIFEYLLLLSIKTRRREIADFTRGISPLLFHMFRSFLHKRCKEDVIRYCTYNSSKDYYNLRAGKMPLDLLEHYNKYYNGLKQGDFKDGFLSASNMLPLIQYKCNDGQAVRLAEELRNFEDKARNAAAHKIIEISDEWLKDMTGMDSTEALEKAKRFFLLIDSAYSKQADWNSYDYLNKEIEAQMRF